MSWLGDKLKERRERRRMMKIVDITIFLYHDCDTAERHMVISPMPTEELRAVLIMKQLAEWYEKNGKKDEKEEED